MGKDVIETKEVDYEEMAAQAELEAEADEVASAGREVTEEEMPEDEEDGGNRFEVEFFKEYAFNNGIEVKKIKSIDLSGLLDLTTIDAERFDRILIKQATALKTNSQTQHTASMLQHMLQGFQLNFSIC